MSAIPKDAVRAMLADQIDGGERTVEPAADAPVVAPVASAPVTPDLAAMIQVLATALGQSNQTQLDAFRDVMATSQRQARNPIPEGTDASNPQRSAFNPKGERDSPRPGLKCQMFHAQYDEDGKIEAAYPIVEDSCNAFEQKMLNDLQQGEGKIKRNNGKAERVVIATRVDAAGKMNRLIIGYPHGWMSKEDQRDLPSLVSQLCQLLGMSEHEAREYYNEPELVAA